MPVHVIKKDELSLSSRWRTLQGPVHTNARFQCKDYLLSILTFNKVVQIVLDDRPSLTFVETLPEYEVLLIEVQHL